MDQSEIQLGDAAPQVGDMVEVELLMPSGVHKWYVPDYLPYGESVCVIKRVR